MDRVGFLMERVGLDEEKRSWQLFAFLFCHSDICIRDRILQDWLQKHKTCNFLCLSLYPWPPSQPLSILKNERSKKKSKERRHRLISKRKSPKMRITKGYSACIHVSDIRDSHILHPDPDLRTSEYPISGSIWPSLQVTRQLANWI